MNKKILAILVFFILVYGLALTSSAVSPELLTDASGTWTVPPGVTEITVEIIGGGGGSKAPLTGGSGGGGGGFYRKVTIPVIPGEEFIYTVGSSGSSAGGNGGTTTWVGNNINMRAVGGYGSTGTNGGRGGYTDGSTFTRTFTNPSFGVGGQGASASGLKGGGGGAGGSGFGDGGYYYNGNATGNIGGLGVIDFCGNGGAGGIGASGTNGLNYGGGAGGSYRTETAGFTGQTGAPGAVRITYAVSDITPPSVPSFKLSSEVEWTNASEVTVTITPGTDEPGGSGAAATTYTTLLNGGTESCETTYTGPFQITEEGTTVIKAKTYDKAGNVSAVTEKTVKIDLTKPSAPSVILDPDDDWTNTTVNVTITPGTDIAGGSGAAATTYTTQLNGGTESGETTYTGPFQITEEGTTVITAKTYDNAGNVSAVTEETVKIDLTKPITPSVTLSPADEWTNAAEVTVTIVPGTDEESGSGAADTTYTTQFNDILSDETIYTNPIVINKEGITVVSAITYDNAGNNSQPAVKIIKIDRTKPTISYNGVEYTDGNEIYLGYITKGFKKSVSYTKLDEASGFGNIYGIESIPTDIPGLNLEHDLTVTDRAGNSATVTFKYKVISMDDLMSLLAPVRENKTYKINSSIPVKLQITEDGVPVPMSAVDLSFTLRLADPSGKLTDPVRTNHAGETDIAVFALSADGLTCQYNLSTKDFAAGIYTLEIYIGDKADTEEGHVGTIELELR